MHTYIRHICAPVHVREILQHIYESDQGLVAAGYSIYIYIIGIAIKSIGTKAKNTTYLLALANFLSASYCFLNFLKIFFEHFDISEKNRVSA